MPTSPGSDGPQEHVRSHVSTAGDVEETPDEATAATAEVAELQAELARTQDRHRRALADLDNYRKRVERDGDRRAADARRAVLGEWLEAVDSVERALTMEPGDPGLGAVLEQMEAILARHGVTRMDPVGTRFDPERYEAIAVAPAANVPDHTVLEVARSGFAFDDGSVLRPALVVVARRPAGEA